MESFYARLYLALQARIQTELPEIKWIEQDFGQDVFDDWRPNVAFPAVLIDFSNSTYTAMQGNIQLGEVKIQIRLLFAPFSQSYHKAPSAVKDKSLDYFEVEHRLFTTLQGWTNGDCTPLIREQARSNNRNEIGLRIRELTFSTEYEDWSLNT